MGIIDDLKLQYKIGGIVQKLIFWNIGCFVVAYLFVFLFWWLNVDFNFWNYISLSSDASDLLWKPWSIITYFFFHADILHIFFNMIVLNFAGRLFLTYFAPKQLFGLYVFGGIFAGLVFLLSYFSIPSLADVNVPMVGASGAIMALLFATVTYNPLMELRLLLIGNVKLWHIAFALIVLDLIQLPLSNTGGHLAHLGGAFFGYLYMKLLQNGTDLSKIVSNVLDFFANLFKPKQQTPFKKVHKNYKSQPQAPKASKIVTKDKIQQQIDEILDKISQSGYDSLTKEEKEFLFKAGK